MSSYIEDEESPEQDVFQDLEQERFFNLISALKQSVFKQVEKFKAHKSLKFTCNSTVHCYSVYNVHNWKQNPERPD